MKRIRYSKYVPDPAGEMSMEDLLSALSDYLLQSGFQNYMFYEHAGGRAHARRPAPAPSSRRCWTAICSTRKCANGCEQMQMDGTLDELIEQLIERMEQEDYISHRPAARSFAASRSVGGQTGEAQQQAQV